GPGPWAGRRGGAAPPTAPDTRDDLLHPRAAAGQRGCPGRVGAGRAPSVSAAGPARHTSLPGPEAARVDAALGPRRAGAPGAAAHASSPGSWARVPPARGGQATAGGKSSGDRSGRGEAGAECPAARLEGGTLRGDVPP